MGKGKSVCIGYKYFLGMHMVLCHGPIDSLTKITAGDKDAWTGNVSSNQQIYVDSPELFGGEKKEGGVQGYVDIMMGGSAQAQNDYLTSKISTIMPAFRGVVSAVLRQCYLTAMSPYPKAWAFLVKRCPARDWYPATAEISGGANGAHIIYEVLTNTQWGMGYATDTIDEVSFREVALALYNEGLSLSFELTSTDSIENFIYTVVQHINGMFYTKPDTGKFALKLLRNNYTVSGLPLYNEDNIITLESFERPSYAEMVNEMVVTFRPQGTDKDDTVTVQDLAAIQAQEGIVSQSVSYPGIDTAANAARVAMRDLRQKSTPLARVKLKVLRSAWATGIGDCVKFSWKELSISEMVLRVLGVNLGTMTGGEIIIDAIEDVFGLPNATYIGTQPSGWVNPVVPPQAPTIHALYEATYWDLARTLPASDLAALTTTSAILLGYVGAPNTLAINFEMWVAQAGTYAMVGSGGFSPYASLGVAYGKTDTTISITSFSGNRSQITMGTYAIWDDEIVRVDSINTTTLAVTLGRGCLDTVPQTHNIGSKIIFCEGNVAVDQNDYITGENVSAKLLTRTGSGLLALASATADNITMAGRFIRPYPPGQFKINNLYYPATHVSDNGSMLISWAPRNRTQQLATIIDFDDGAVTAEPGTTYSLTITRVSNGATLLSLTGLSANSYNAVLPTGQYDINITLWSVRDTYASFQSQTHRLTFTYYGATRITEDANTRTTESGDTRIVE